MIILFTLFTATFLAHYGLFRPPGGLIWNQTSDVSLLRTIRWSSGMRDYRAYILGIDGHRFVRVKDFSSGHPDDEAALSAAKQLIDGHDVELWDCGRLVARLSPDGEVSSPELAPFRVSNAPADGGNISTKPTVEPTSLSQVSKLVGARSKENPLLLGW
jgi:hypothetical protein